MKKLLPLLITVILILCSACSDSKPAVATSDNAPSDNSSDEIMVGARQEIGDFTIELKSYRMAQTRVWATDYDIIVVTYEWTNNSGGPRSFEGEFKHYAFQNGIACNEHLFVVDEAETSEANDPWREVQSGNTQTVRKAYELLDTTSDINIEVGTRYGYLAHAITVDADQPSPSQKADTPDGIQPGDIVPSGTELYKNVLDEYIGYVQGDDIGNYNDCRYALYDIDGNDVEELLVRYKEGHYDEITMLYTYANGKTNEVGYFWPRYYMMLDGKGNIYVNGDGGYESTTIEAMRISDDGTELITVEAWAMEGAIYTHNSIDGINIISKGAFESAWDNISKATDGFVDSLNWQPLVADSSGDVLYKGQPINNFLGRTIDSLSGVLGSALGDNYAGMGHYYEYDDLSLYVDDATGEVTDILTQYPYLFDVDGSMLDKNAAELTNILGAPTYQGEQEPGEIYYGYEVAYERGGYTIRFLMTRPEGKTRAILVSRISTADNNVPTDSPLSKVRYKGESIINWMGASLPSLRDVFGAPEAEGIVAEGGAYGFRYDDGIAFVKREQGEDIEFIEADPSLFSVDGISLATNRNQLVSLFGEPDSEYWGEDYGDPAYFIRYLYQDKYSVYFTLDDPNGAAYYFGIYEGVE